MRRYPRLAGCRERSSGAGRVARWESSWRGHFDAQLLQDTLEVFRVDAEDGGDLTLTVSLAQHFQGALKLGRLPCQHVFPALRGHRHLARGWAAHGHNLCQGHLVAVNLLE